MKEKNKRIVKLTARKLRKGQTKCEAMFWAAVRSRKLLGFKFLRQHPLVLLVNGKKRFFVVDFYCHEKRLAVELDGSVHLNRKEHDKGREGLIACFGIKVIRFSNNMIENCLEEVLMSVKKNLVSRTPSLVREGEGG